MELSVIPQEQNNTYATVIDEIILLEEMARSKPFIEANTIEASFEEIRDHHLIPVFLKDNEPVISHVDFINATDSIVREIYSSECILKPAVRLSHPIKGRIPEAKNKAANELLEYEKTLYYERMAFVIEIPSIHDEIDGNKLSLCIGGVKAYNLDNLYNKKGADEHFKVFIGFKNKVCTNLCVWTDGFMEDLRVNSIGQLRICIKSLIENYNASYHLHQLQQLAQFSLTEQEFAMLVGRCKMYPHLPTHLKAEIPSLLLGESQINTVVKDYYKDTSFCRDREGNINLWKLYNLFTGANKSSYIDNFIDRSVNAYQFVERLRFALQDKTENWFLN
ncbi:DUF3871 family protein [Segetibacter koreensis]|uniref:DUF3871 family protein n=1 Tax=Segetibacter koreensis TaxID=398037 RepID=UPI0003630599|nr:DUF3871 family protein [Segetibacter koreensis]